MIAIYSICSITILPQSPETKRELAIFDFYQYMTKDYNTSLNQKEPKIIYFIGSSQVETGLNTLIVEEDLKKNEIEAKIYNLGISGDTPLRRLKEMHSIIESHPDLVIIGITYYAFHEDSVQDFSKFARGSTIDEYSKLDEYSKSLYGEKISTPSFFQKYDISSYFGNGQKMMGYFRYGPKDPERSKNMFKSELDFETESASAFFLKERHDNVIRKLNPENGTEGEKELFLYTRVSETKNPDKKAFLYFVQKLKENNISVIIVNMPINPMISDKIPDSTRENYSDVINNTVNITGAQYYDYEKILPVKDFIDVLHFHTNNGKKIFSHEMARLLLTEMAKQ